MEIVRRCLYVIIHTRTKLLLQISDYEEKEPEAATVYKKVIQRRSFETGTDIIPENRRGFRRASEDQAK